MNEVGFRTQVAAVTNAVGAARSLTNLATGEPVPLARARALFHWVVVVGLGTFDIAIFTKVVQGLIAIW